MKNKYKANSKKSVNTIMALCFTLVPLASAATTTLIGNGINGGELDSNLVKPTLFFPNQGTQVHWSGGVYVYNDPIRLTASILADYPEFRNGPNLSPTIGNHWMDTLGGSTSQTITNNTIFNVAANTTMTLSIDFSRWEFGSGTTPGSVMTFLMGSTVLGNITYNMDTNGLGVWNTYTVTNVPVAAGLNQTFSINTVGDTTNRGFAIDNLTLTSTVVPEPSTALMGVAALSFAIGRRRRA